MHPHDVRRVNHDHPAVEPTRMEDRGGEQLLEEFPEINAREWFLLSIYLYLQIDPLPIRHFDLG